MKTSIIAAIVPLTLASFLKYSDDPLFKKIELVEGFPHSRLGDGRLYPVPFQPSKQKIFLCNRPLITGISQLTVRHVKILYSPYDQTAFNIDDAPVYAVQKVKSLLLGFTKSLYDGKCSEQTLIFIEGMQDFVLNLGHLQGVLVGVEWLCNTVIPLMKKSLQLADFLTALFSSYDQSNPIIAVYLAPLCESYPEFLSYETNITVTDISNYFRFTGNLWPLFEALKGPSVGSLDICTMGFNSESSAFRQNDSRYKEIYRLTLRSLESYKKFRHYLSKCNHCINAQEILGELQALDLTSKLEIFDYYMAPSKIGLSVQCSHTNLHAVVDLNKVLSPHISFPLWIRNRQEKIFSLLIWVFLLCQEIQDSVEQLAHGIPGIEMVLDSIVTWKHNTNNEALDECTAADLLVWIKEVNNSINSQILQALQTQLENRIQARSTVSPSLVTTVSDVSAVEGGNVNIGDFLMTIYSNDGGYTYFSSPYAGRIRRVLVQIGQVIAPGQVLLQFASGESIIYESTHFE